MQKTIKNSKLSELRKQSILVQLGSGKSVSKIAREMDVNGNHIRSWLKSSDGLERIENSLESSWLILENRLPDLVEKSLNALDSALSDTFMSSEKIRSAKAVLQIFTQVSKRQQPCRQCQEKTLNLKSFTTEITSNQPQGCEPMNATTFLTDANQLIENLDNLTVAECAKALDGLQFQSYNADIGVHEVDITNRLTDLLSLLSEIEDQTVKLSGNLIYQVSIDVNDQIFKVWSSNGQPDFGASRELESWLIHRS